MAALTYLGALDRLDRTLTLDHIMRCHNFDGGFGTSEGAESHAGQGACVDLGFNGNRADDSSSLGRTVFVCVGTLSILNALDRIDIDKLGWWLSERQLPHGGLNGRPEKLEDVRAAALSLSTSHASASGLFVHWLKRNWDPVLAPTGVL